jgi:phage terminase Nu1 subunit (DNA packaging protein)
MTTTFPPTLVERPALARILGCSVRTIAALESERVIQAAARGKGRRPSLYALEATVPAYLAHRERQATASEVTPRDRRDLSVATLNELRIAREQGALVPKDEVIRTGRAIVETARTRLLRLPSDLRRADLVTESGEVAAEDIVRDALLELSRLEGIA